MYLCMPNMKFLCLTLCQGEVCTDDDNNANDANTNDDGQSMIVQGSLVDKPNEPKKSEIVFSNSRLQNFRMLNMYVIYLFSGR